MKIKQLEDLLAALDFSVLRHFETFDAELSKSQFSGKFILKLRLTAGNRFPDKALDTAKLVFGLEADAIWKAPNVWSFEN